MAEQMVADSNISNEEYRQRETALREELVDLQFDFTRRRDRALVVILTGLDTIGVREANHRVYQWLEPHHVETVAFAPPAEDERNRPTRWRHMINLPPRGRVAFFLGSWYTEIIAQRIDRRLGRHEFERALEDIARFERMLVAERVTLVKIWLAMSAEDWHRRLGRMRRERDRRAAAGEWGELDAAAIDRLALMPEELSRVTGTVRAPWLVLPSGDHRQRDVAIGMALARALAVAPSETPAGQPAETPPSPAIIGHRLAALAAESSEPAIPRVVYEEQLADLQHRLGHLSQTRRFQRIAVVAAFEGVDAAGKGGVIQRATAPLDPRIYRVRPIGEPNDQERARPYLWRFWRQLPARGGFCFFDRSWYGRVLVERVEGLIEGDALARAYDEINDFERSLRDGDFVPVKFWLAISKDEQLRRFQAREATPFKRFKLTEADWRARGMWDPYQAAAADMIERTSTDPAPWHVIPANDKLHARVRVLRALIDAIEKAV